MEETPIREIKPVVVPAQYFILGPVISGFLSLFPGGFVFIISNMIYMQTVRANTPIVSYGIAAYLVSFVAAMALIGVKMFKEPSRTAYTIFPDRLEYYEGLWNKHRRTLVFDQVIDVELTEGVLQQTQKAGTITLITQQLVSDGEAKLSNRRIALTNVPQPKETYDLIRRLALEKSGA